MEVKKNLWTATASDAELLFSQARFYSQELPSSFWNSVAWVSCSLHCLPIHHEKNVPGSKKHGHFSQEVIQKLFTFPDFYHPIEFHICYIKKEPYKTPDKIIKIRRLSTIIYDSREKDLNTTIQSLNIMLQ